MSTEADMQGQQRTTGGAGGSAVGSEPCALSRRTSETAILSATNPRSSRGRGGRDPADEVDSLADMEPGERAELEAAIEEGYEDIKRGDVEDARAYAERLLAKK
jgi:hypothetical protein